MYHMFRNQTRSWTRKCKTTCITLTEPLLTRLMKSSTGLDPSIPTVSHFHVSKSRENIFKSLHSPYSTFSKSPNFTSTLIISPSLPAWYCQKDTRKLKRQRSIISPRKSSLSVRRCFMIGNFIIVCSQWQSWRFIRNCIRRSKERCLVKCKGR